MTSLRPWHERAPPSPLVFCLLVLTTDDDEAGRRRRAAASAAWVDRLSAWPESSVRAFLVVANPSIDDSDEGVIGGNETSPVSTLVVSTPERKPTIGLKVLRALRYLYERSRYRPAFVAKTDDDTFVCLRELVSKLPLSLALRDTIYMGAMTIGRPVEVRRGGKWEDLPHRRLFGLSVYPDYAQGVRLRAGLSNPPGAFSQQNPSLCTLALTVDQSPRG